MKLALMIIDLQKAYYNEDTKKSMNSACEYINALIPKFRKAGYPIIWVQHKDIEDGSIPGKEGFEFIDLLKPGENDYRITKEYGNAFNKTDLAAILAKENIKDIILTGFCAEYCVLSTYRGAEDLDLMPIFLKNAIASDNKTHVDFVESISTIASYRVISKILNEEK